MDYLLLGKLIKEAREANGLKQSDVAIICNVTPQTISVWEKGTTRIDIENLARLCERYNISCSDLINVCLGLDETKNIKTKQEEPIIVKKYNSLNSEGQNKAESYIDDLISSGRYKTNAIISRADDKEIADSLLNLTMDDIKKNNAYVNKVYGN